MRVAAALAVPLLCFASPTEPRRTVPDSELVEMTVQDVYAVPHHAHVVLLKTKRGATFLPIWIGSQEALAISLRLARQAPPRPLTHDLMDKVIGTLGGKIMKIQIEDVRDAVFLGRIFLRQGRATVNLDARPSDSIALAVGSGVPIFAARRVLERAGVNDKDFRVKLPSRPDPGERRVRTEGSL